MEIETVNETEDVLELQISGINEAIANSLRRAMIVKVPTLAVEELEVTRNESGLIDEIIANRVGQVPLTIPEDLSEDETVHLALEQEGPGTVLAEDLKADIEEVTPVNPEAIIVELKDEQGLTFEATAVFGTGEEHAKHQGGTVGYEKIDDETYRFRIESTSGYSNEELFETAIEGLKTELDQFEEAVEEL